MKNLLWLLVFATLTPLAHAGRWQCEVPGGAYVVDTTQIVSISTHEYVVDGAARVTELTIATRSAVTARFYFLEPPLRPGSGRAQEIFDKVEERAGLVAERLGQDAVWRKVVKNYPTTTHAHTVEYRLETKEQIQKLFDSVNDAWRGNKDVAIKVATGS